MATLKYTTGGVLVTASGGTTQVGAPGFVVISNTFDATKLYSATATGTYAALSSTDVVELLTVPANYIVLAVTATVVTAEGAACTLGIGDGAGTSGYLAAFDANATAGTSLHSAATSAYSVAVGGGKMYDAADTIDVLVNTAATDVTKVRIEAFCLVMQ